MKTPNNILRFQILKKVVEELTTLEPRTTSSCPVSHGYIGVIIQNTKILLIAPASLFPKEGKMKIELTEKARQKLMVSLNGSLSRSFLSDIHGASEEGLICICKERGILVESKLKKEIEELLLKIQQEAGHSHSVETLSKKLRNKTHNFRPNLMEYVHPLLKLSHLDRRGRKTWIDFFEALNILRNKASHADLRIKETEREKLIAGGFSRCVETTGDLKMGPELYPKIASNILNFFDLVSV